MQAEFSFQRKIRDIQNDDTQIQVTGYVKEISDDKSFILEDKTGEIKVLIGNLDFNFKPKDLINVIGELNFNIEGNKSIDAKFIQDMNKLNFTYYQKLYELKKELE